ncbi:hypothetical protein MESS2_480005 [Mesorhizobium metallidurans STM 2683]|uniref:HTH gntR-type domain-containing protein n=1 Tax=Mesorhizobium metallidurans STM 2683 TaxID=1297569 RepID=M5ET22_9HYPH|nr:hypothetical protein MESS2_480005 [Mesorhizobium metallidurans STM 2683]
MAFHISLVGRKDLSGEIYRQIRRAILDRRLRPGDPLPPGRELARTLAVSRATVTVAYERLAAEGFVTSRQGSGTFVSGVTLAGREKTRRRSSTGVIQPRPVWEGIPLLTAFEVRARFDFRTGLPDASLFPHRHWRRSVAQALRSSEAASGFYEHPAGHRDLRAAIARQVGMSRGSRHRQTTSSSPMVRSRRSISWRASCWSQVTGLPSKTPATAPRDICSSRWAFTWSGCRWIGRDCSWRHCREESGPSMSRRPTNIRFPSR